MEKKAVTRDVKIPGDLEKTDYDRFFTSTTAAPVILMARRTAMTGRGDFWVVGTVVGATGFKVA